MKRLLLIGLLLPLAACKPEPAGEPVIRTEIGKGSDEMAAARQSLSPCRRVEFEGVALTDCVADPASHSIAMALADGDGAPFRSLKHYAQALGDDAANVAFAVNGGMFDGDGKPVGYYVERGERLKELDRADGTGNFYMKPNGVFHGSGGKWEIRTADSFFANVGDRPQFGTQSGPMLVIDGALHPEFQDDGPSRTIRNGVGIDGAGRAHFVRSEDPVSFGQFARFFRDELKTPNALYLDGGVSALWDPLAERLDDGAPLGPLIVVTNRGNGAP